MCPSDFVACGYGYNLIGVCSSSVSTILGTRSASWSTHQILESQIFLAILRGPTAEGEGLEGRFLAAAKIHLPCARYACFSDTKGAGSREVGSDRSTQPTSKDHDALFRLRACSPRRTMPPRRSLGTWGMDREPGREDELPGFAAIATALGRHALASRPH